MNDIYQPPSTVSETAWVQNMDQYRKMYERSIKDPEGFWAEQAEQFVWFKKWSKVRDFNYDVRKGKIFIEWFRDAKFGIYFHWGVYSVPSFGSEWYPRHMHLKDHAVYKHHLATYGSPDKFGYHDMVPLFKAENFDADEWAELFQKAGARFAGPVAEHEAAPQAECPLCIRRGDIKPVECFVGGEPPLQMS